MQQYRGFTLIEVLIVLVLISIVAAGVTLSVRHTRQWNQKIFTSEVSEKLSLLQEYAILQPATLKVLVEPRRILFSKWQIEEVSNRGYWMPLEESYLQPISIPTGISVQLKVMTDATPQEEASENEIQPILISTNGDWTPFNLWIGPSGKTPTFRLQGLLGGELTMTLLDETHDATR